jgi:hypothetical protein
MLLRAECMTTGKPNYPIWRIAGILLGVFLVWRSIVDDTLKVQTFIMGAGAIYVGLF